MVIFKKILKNALIVLGVLVAVALVLVFCMFFFRAKIFGYTFKYENRSSSELAIEATSGRIEITATSIPINIQIGGSNTVLLTDDLNGICKQTQNSDGKNVDGKIILKQSLQGNAFCVNVVEPKKLIAFYGDSHLNVVLTQETAENCELIIKTKSSKINFSKEGDYFVNVKIYSNRAKVSANSQFGYAYLQCKSGKAKFNGDVDDLYTIGQRANIYFKNCNNNATIMLNHGYLNFDTVKKTLKYSGYKWIDETVVRQKDATSAKIEGKKVDGGLIINAKSFSANITEVNDSLMAYAIRSGKLKISKSYLVNSSSVDIAQGKVNLKNLSAKLLNISTKSAKINLTLAQSANNSEIEVSSKTGNIEIYGESEEGNVKSVYNGDLKVNSNSGNINLVRIGCRVNAKTKKNGKISARLYSLVANKSTLETSRGNIDVYIQSNTKAFLVVSSGKGRTIDLPATKEFLTSGEPTPIYNASFEDQKLLTFLSSKGKISISEFYA